MRVLLVHPSPLLYSELYLRLEPLGLERVAAAVRAAGHDVRLMDLQVFTQAEYLAELAAWQPRAVGFSLNYLANVPEVIDLAKATRQQRPDTFVFVGGHSASFIAGELLEHGAGAIDCVVRGEGEVIAPRVLEAIGDHGLERLPGVVTTRGAGPSPTLLENLDTHLPARDLGRRRHKYFLGVLDPCASAELTRGCPWDCSFCSAWTFYGRSYRKSSPESAAEDLARIKEPNVFLVDDVAFIHAEDGFAIGKELERRKIRKQYYLETRCDVLLKNRDVFAYWRELGLYYMFLGVEALDAEALKRHRKRVSTDANMEALEVARKLGLTVATPYPGTETWLTEPRQLTSHDYRLYDVQHAVLPTRLPLHEFYRQLVQTQAVLNRKHLGWGALSRYGGPLVRALSRGQTNYLKMLWKFTSVYNADRQFNDHGRPVTYALRPRRLVTGKPKPMELYVHQPVSAHKASA